MDGTTIGRGIAVQPSSTVDVLRARVHTRHVGAQAPSTRGSLLSTFLATFSTCIGKPELAGIDAGVNYLVVLSYKSNSPPRSAAELPCHQTMDGGICAGQLQMPVSRDGAWEW